MDQALKRTLCILALLIGFTGWVLGQSQKYAGSYFSYECLGSNQYYLELHILWDCAISSPDESTNIRFNVDGNPTGSVTLQRTSIEEIDQICASSIENSICSGGTVPGYKHITLGNTFDLSSYTGAAEIAFQWENEYRVPTLNLQASQGQYARLVIYPTVMDCNDSPQRTLVEVPSFCSNETIHYNLGMASDNQDELIQYSFATALIPQGSWFSQPALYNAGYTATAPLPGASIDPNTGDVSFNNSTNGAYNITVQVDEYNESGNLMSQQFVDQIIKVQNCSSSPPTSSTNSFTLESGTAVQTTPDSLRMCYGDDFCVAYTFQSNSGTELSIQSNLAEVLPGATISTVGTNPLTAEICWTANPNFLSGPVIISAHDDQCDEYAFTQKTFYVEIIPGVYAGEDLSFCPGQEIQLDASGSTNYSWISISGDPVTELSCTNCPNPHISPSQQTVFEVQGSNPGNGCSSTDQVELFPALSIESEIFDAGCDGDDGAYGFVVTAGSGSYSMDFYGDSYSWQDQEEILIENLEPGDYSFNIHDDLLSCTETINFSIGYAVDFPEPDIIAPNSICGFNLQLDGQVNSSNIQWFATGPGNASFNSDMIEDPLLSVDQAGEYWVYLAEVNEGFGCTGWDSLLVNFRGPIDLYAGVDTALCSLTYDMPAWANNGTWSWFGLGPGSVSFSNSDTDPGSTVTVSQFGNYDFIWSFNGNNGCDSSGTIQIQFLPQPHAQSPDTLTFCELMGNQLEATAAGSGEIGRWDILSGNFLYNPVLAQSPINNQGSYGEFLAVWTVSNAACQSQDTTLLRYIEPEEAQINGFDIQICGLNGSVQALNDQGNWSSPDPEIHIDSPLTNNTSVSASDYGAYTIIWTVGEGDCNDSDSRTIVFTEPVSLDVGILPDKICGAESIVLSASASGHSSLEWISDGNGTFGNSQSLTTTYSPSDADLNSGEVTLSLSGSGVGPCPSNSSSGLVQIISPALIEAELLSDNPSCSDDWISLNGTADHVSSSTWTSSGDGEFSNTGEDPFYLPGENDISTGSISLTYTGMSTDPVCPNASASLDINIIEAAYAGQDSMIVVCISSPAIELSPLLGTGAHSGGTWVDEQGHGALQGTVFNPVFAGEGSFQVEYHVPGTLPCDEDVAIVQIDVVSGGLSGLDSTLSICQNSEPILLNNLLSHGSQTGGQWSILSGIADISTGFFHPQLVSTGPYSLIYVSSSPACGNDTAQFWIHVESAPLLESFSVSNSICEGESIAYSLTHHPQNNYQWMSSGDGFFNSQSSQGTYTPGPLDISTGSITIQVEVSGHISCPSLSQSEIININPQANPGMNGGTTLCSSSASIDLHNLLSSGAQGGGIWTETSSSGALSGSTFDPAIAGIGEYQFLYTIPATQSCPDSSAQFTITVSETAQAGENTNEMICAAGAEIHLLSLLDGSPQAGGTWSTSSSPDGLNNGYLDPSILNPGIHTYVYSIDIPSCGSSDQAELRLDVSLPPMVNIDPDTMYACSGANFQLEALGSQFSDLTWNTSGSGLFEQEESLSTPYIASPEDWASGLVHIEVMASGASVCPTALDSLFLVYEQAVEVQSLIAPEESCGNSTIEIELSVENNSSITWSSPGGDGLLDLSDPFHILYTPGNNDLLNASVNIHYSLSGHPLCPTVNQEIPIALHMAPEAGSNQEVDICISAGPSNLTDYLEAGISTIGDWICPADPDFLEAANFLPSEAGIGLHEVFYFVDGQGHCPHDSALFQIEVSSGPDAGLGSQIELCDIAPDQNLFALIPGSPDAGGQWSGSAEGVVSSDGLLTPSEIEIGQYELFYTVSLTGCADAQSTMNLNMVAGPSVSIISEVSSICSGESIQVLADTSASQSIAWSSSSDGAFSSNNAVETLYSPSALEIANGQATIQVEAQGISGCPSSSESFDFLIHETPNAQAGDDLAACGTEIQLGATASVGEGQWSGPTGLIFSNPGSGSSSVFASSIGTYVLDWTENNQGCIASDQVEIRFLASPDTAWSMIECVNGNTEYILQLGMTGGDELSYEHSGNPGIISNQIFTSEPLGTGTSYTIALFDGNNCNPTLIEGSYECPSLTQVGSLQSDTLHACIGEDLHIEYDNGEFLDPNDSLLFVLHSASIGSGTIIAQSAEPLFSNYGPLSPGETYFVTAIAGDASEFDQDFELQPGMVVSNSSPVYVHNLPSLEPLGEYGICPEQSIDVSISLHGQAPFSLVYENANGPQTYTSSSDHGILQVHEAGSIQFLTLEDRHCQISLDMNIEVSELAEPNWSAPMTHITCSAELEPIPLELAGSGPWSFLLQKEGELAQNLSANQSETSISYTGEGLYTFYELSDANCASQDSLQVQVEILPSPISYAGEDLILCSGDEGHIGMPAIPGVEYQWSSLEYLLNPDSSSSVINPINEGDMALTSSYVLTSTVGTCTTSDEVLVTIAPLPIQLALQAPAEACEGSSIVLQASGANYYYWESNQGFVDSIHAEVSIQAQENLEIQITGYNLYGCSLLDSAAITINPSPEPSYRIEITDPCPPTQVILFNESDTESYNDCEWFVSDGEEIMRDCQQLIFEVADFGEYRTLLYLNNEFGCEVFSTIDTLKLIPPSADFALNPTNPTFGSSYVYVSAAMEEAPVQNWTLNEEPTLLLDNYNLDIQALAPGSHEVCLYLENEQGCSAEACKSFDIEDDIDIWVPNAFSPNQDEASINELFYPVIRGWEKIQDYEFRIYDRSGSSIFQTERIGEGWNGHSAGGQELPIGMYQWELRLRSPYDTDIRVLQGSVHLLR